MAAKQTKVTAEEFRQNWDHFVKAASNNGPIAVVEKNKVVGFFVAPQHLDALYDPSLAELVKERMRETKTVPHEEVMAKAKEIIKKHRLRHAAKKEKNRGVVRKSG